MSTVKQLPKRGELVVATVKEITDYGAYVFLDDYEIKGFLPISEVSSKWTKRIEDVIRPNQKIVVKVLRIDKLTQSVDVSLKDVSPSERERVLRDWKRNRRGRKILEEMCKELGFSLDYIMSKLGDILSNYITIYDLILDIVTNPEILNKLSFSSNESQKILNFLKKRVHPKKYILEYLIELTYIGRGGVYKIKNTLEKLDMIIQKKARITPEIVHVSAPKYSIKMLSYRPEELKIVKKEIAKFIEECKDVHIEVKEVKEKVEI